MVDTSLDPKCFSEIFKDPNASSGAGRVHYAAHPVLMPDLTRMPLYPYDLQRLDRQSEVVLVMDNCQIPLSYNSDATAWA